MVQLIKASLSLNHLKTRGFKEGESPSCKASLYKERPQGDNGETRLRVTKPEAESTNRREREKASERQRKKENRGRESIE